MRHLVHILGGISLLAFGITLTHGASTPAYYWQADAGWCWATSATMVGTYYKASPAAGTTFTANSNFIRPWTVAARFKKNKATGGNGTDSATVLTEYVGKSFSTSLTFKLNDEAALIAKLHPLVQDQPVWFAFAQDSGHAIVIYSSTGTTSSDYVYVMDPSGAAFGEKVAQRITWRVFYDTIRSCCQHWKNWYTSFDPVYYHVSAATVPSSRSNTSATVDFVTATTRSNSSFQVYDNQDPLTPALRLQWDGATHPGYYLEDTLSWYKRLLNSLPGMSNRPSASIPGYSGLTGSLKQTDSIRISPCIHRSTGSGAVTYTLNIYRQESGGTPTLVKTATHNLSLSSPSFAVSAPAYTVKVVDLLPTGYDGKSTLTYRVDASVTAGGSTDTSSINFYVKESVSRLVALAIDASGSNVTTDPNRNRVVAAKYVLNSLVSAAKTGGGVPSDLTSVINFTSTSQVLSKNVDPADSLKVLNRIGEEGGTDIANAIDTARVCLEEAVAKYGVPLGNASIFVFTDGENNAGDSPVRAAIAAAKAKNIAVHCGLLAPDFVPYVSPSGSEPARHPTARLAASLGTNGDGPRVREPAAYVYNPIYEVGGALVNSYHSSGGTFAAITTSEDQVAFVKQVAMGGLTRSIAPGPNNIIGRSFVYKQLPADSNDIVRFSAVMGETVRLWVYSTDFTPDFLVTDVDQVVVYTKSSSTGGWQLAKFTAPYTGEYAIDVFSRDGRSGLYAVQASSANDLPLPTIATQPVDTTAAAGTVGQIFVSATGPDLTYQWYFNGKAIAGGTGSVLTLSPVATTSAGSYYVVVSTPNGKVTSRAATFTVATDSRATLNLSTRGNIQPGENATIMGVVLGGKATLLARAVGPGLLPFGLSDAAGSVQLTVYKTGQASPLQTNVAGWQNVANPADLILAARQVGAFDLADRSYDAAALITLEAGSYSFVAEPSTENASGVGLTEVYLIQDSDFSNRLVNMSSRGRTAPGSGNLIMGVMVNKRSTLLFRGIGPGLRSFNVTGAAPSVSVKLVRLGGSVPMAENDGWSTSASASAISAAAVRVGAFALAAGSRDSCILITVDPGSYTALVAPSGDDARNAGVALAECYCVP